MVSRSGLGGAARWVHVDRAAGGDSDHPDRQCGGIAGCLAGAFAPTSERGGASASRRACGGAGFGAQERDTERHSFAARPCVSADLSRHRSDRPDPAAGGQPHHPDRGGPRVFGGDAADRTFDHYFECYVPTDQRWRNLPVRRGQQRRRMPAFSWSRRWWRRAQPG